MIVSYKRQRHDPFIYIINIYFREFTSLLVVKRFLFLFAASSLLFFEYYIVEATEEIVL